MASLKEKLLRMNLSVRPRKKYFCTCYGQEVRLMLKFLTTSFDTPGIRYVLVRPTSYVLELKRSE